MASQGKSTTGASPASTASTTPLPPGAADNDTDLKAQVEDEERDAFLMEGPACPTTSQGPRSLPYNRPVPLLHHNHTPPRSLGLMKSSSQNALLLHIHPRLQSGFSGSYNAPPSTPQQTALPVVPINTPGRDYEADSQKMSRSISDSTLRRAALHLNLNQSVLPSFTSIQQFKANLKLLNFDLIDVYLHDDFIYRKNYPSRHDVPQHTFTGSP